MRKVDYGPQARKIIADTLRRRDAPEMTCDEALAAFKQQYPNTLVAENNNGRPSGWSAQDFEAERQRQAGVHNALATELGRQPTLDEFYAKLSREDVDREDDDEEFEDDLDDEDEDDDEDPDYDEEDDDEDWDDDDLDDEEEDDDDEFDEDDEDDDDI